MADNGSGGIQSGSSFVEIVAADVYIKPQPDGTIESKPANAAAAATLLDGVAAVNTCTFLIAGATADDGSYFRLPTQAGLFIVYMDLDEAGASIPSVSDADFYVGVPFVDTATVEVMAASLVTAINNNIYSSIEIEASAVAGVVTLTALKGGECPVAVDVDMSTLATIANTTPGTGDYDKADKTAEGQIMNTEDTETFNTSQRDEIIVEKEVSFDFKMAMLSEHNLRTMTAKYNNKSTRVVYYAPNSTRKQFETMVAIASVKKIEENGIPLIQVTGKKAAANVSGFYDLYDMANPT